MSEEKIKKFVRGVPRRKESDRRDDERRQKEQAKDNNQRKALRRDGPRRIHPDPRLS